MLPNQYDVGRELFHFDEARCDFRLRDLENFDDYERLQK